MKTFRLAELPRPPDREICLCRSKAWRRRIGDHLGRLLTDRFGQHARHEGVETPSRAAMIFSFSCKVRAVPAGATAPTPPGTGTSRPIGGRSPSIRRWRSARPPAPPRGVSPSLSYEAGKAGTDASQPPPSASVSAPPEIAYSVSAFAIASPSHRSPGGLADMRTGDPAALPGSVRIASSSAAVIFPDLCWAAPPPWAASVPAPIRLQSRSMSPEWSSPPPGSPAASGH